MGLSGKQTDKQRGNAMMTIDEMRARKEELMYTCAIIAEKSGLPLSTVQKVFSGATARPRLKTMEAIEMVLKKPLYSYGEVVEADDTGYAAEEAAAYTAGSGVLRKKAARMDVWNGMEPSERWPRQGEYTTEDYFSIPDDIRVELIDGVIYDLGAPKGGHQIVLGELHLGFRKCIDEHDKPCLVLFAPFDVRLDRDNRTMVQPDLLVICPDEGEDYKNSPYYEEDRGKRLNGAPALVAEILSPSTREKDCTVKLRKYMNAGVKEYWIVDIDNGKVMVYNFEKDVLPTQYSFEDVIPIGLSDGECSIDFSRINAKLNEARRLFPYDDI